MYYIGVDLGGTNIAVGLVNEEGKITHKGSVPTYRDRHYSEILQDMAMLVNRVVEEAGVSMEEVHSIGIGSPGKCDVDNGVLIYANNLKFSNVPMRQEIQKYIDKPVYLDNDANCAAYGESVCGAARGYKNSLTITLGTGVGGGIIQDGKIITGSYYGGGELGHMVIQVDGEPCTCGRKGCLEQYCSATALIRDTRIAAARNIHSKVYELVNGDIRLIDAKVPFDAAKAGDEVGQMLVNNYIKYLAIGIANFINIFEPEVVCVGGGVCAQGDYLLNPLKEAVQGQIYGNAELKTQIKIAELGNDAGIIGAAFLGKDK